MDTDSKDAREYVKFALLMAFITLLSLSLFSFGEARTLSELMRWFMGVFMTVFASFKFVGYKSFSSMFATYDIVAKRSELYGKSFPFIQLFLGVIYLINLLPNLRDLLVVLVAGVSSIGVFQEIRRKRPLHCACLGGVIKLRLSTITLVEDVGMLSMGLLGLSLTYL